MSLKEVTREAQGTSPASATGAQVGDAVAGLDDWQIVTITAQFAADPAGTLDVYVQRYDTGLDKWVDYVHFPTNSAGGGTKSYVVSSVIAPQAIYAVGTDGTPSLAANTYTGGHPGKQCRVWAVGGAGTTTGASVHVTFTGINQ